VIKYSDEFWYENGYWTLCDNDKSKRHPSTTITTPKWRRMMESIFKKATTINNDGTITYRIFTEEDIDEYLNGVTKTKRETKA
jgi:hypothetical protein